MAKSSFASNLEKLTNEVGDMIGNVASDFTNNAGKVANDFTTNAGKVAGDVTANAGKVANEFTNNAGKVAGDWSNSAGKVAGDLTDKAGKMTGELTHNAGKVAADLTKKGGKVAEDVSKKVNLEKNLQKLDKSLPFDLPFVKRKKPNWAKRIGIVLLGVGAGAVVYYFLTSRQGKQQLAQVRETVTNTTNKVAETAEKKATHLTNQAEGMKAEARAAQSSEPVDDSVLVERIRSKMGHVVSQPGAIQVTANQGKVTLSGEIFDNEVNELLSTVNEVGGVQSVTNELKTHPQGQDLPGFPTTAQTA